MFYKHASKISEIFWDGAEEVLSERKRIVKTSNISVCFMQERAEKYTKEINDKYGALGYFVS